MFLSSLCGLPSPFSLFLLPPHWISFWPLSKTWFYSRGKKSKCLRLVHLLLCFLLFVLTVALLLFERKEESCQFPTFNGPSFIISPRTHFALERNKKGGMTRRERGREGGRERVVPRTGWHAGQNAKENAEEKRPVDLWDKQSQTPTPHASLVRWHCLISICNNGDNSTVSNSHDQCNDVWGTAIKETYPMSKRMQKIETLFTQTAFSAIYH